MHLPFLSVYDEGDGIVRLRINFLHEDTDPNVPTLQQRLQNTFTFFGNDMVRTGGIGEFIAGLTVRWPRCSVGGRRRRSPRRAGGPRCTR